MKKPETIETTQRVHLWLETKDGMLMGIGRIQLLERIDRLGSLHKAAASMGMSYRAAWGRMKKTEAVMGQALLEKSGPKSEFHLTKFGREIVRLFGQWQKDVESYALKSAQKVFPWKVRRFEYDDSPQKDETVRPLFED